MTRACVTRSQVSGRTKPHFDAVTRAHEELQDAHTTLRQAEAEAARAPIWRRRAAKHVVTLAKQDTDRAAESYAAAEAAARPTRRRYAKPRIVSTPPRPR